MNVKGPRRRRGSTRFIGISFKNAKVSDVNWPPFWWRFVEFGTSKMSAKPFLRPAFDTNVNSVAEEMKSDLAKAIDRAAAKLAKQ